MEGPCGSDSALPQMRKANILVLALAMDGGEHEGRLEAHLRVREVDDSYKNTSQQGDWK